MNNNREKTGEYAHIAASYVFLGEYYRNYVLADSSLVVKGATKETTEELLTSCEDTLSYLNEEEFEGREKMKSIVYEFLLSIIESQSAGFHEAGIEKARVEKIIASIERDTEATEDNKALAKSAAETVRISYAEKKEASNGNN